MNAMQRELRLFDYIAHMRDAIAQAQSYVDGLSVDDFLTDKKTQDAVVLKIIVLGEAATQIMDEYPDFTTAHPEIPWKQIRGMRNRMAHGYFEINLDVVWQTVQTALPSLREHLSAICID